MPLGRLWSSRQLLPRALSNNNNNNNNDSLDRSSYRTTAHLSSGATPSSSFPLPAAVSVGRPTMSCYKIIDDYHAGIIVETPITNLPCLPGSSLLPRQGSNRVQSVVYASKASRGRYPQSQKPSRPRVPCRQIENRVTSGGFLIQFPSNRHDRDCLLVWVWAGRGVPSFSATNNPALLDLAASHLK